MRCFLHMECMHANTYVLRYHGVVVSLHESRSSVLKGSSQLLGGSGSGVRKKWKERLMTSLEGAPSSGLLHLTCQGDIR